MAAAAAARFPGDDVAAPLLSATSRPASPAKPHFPRPTQIYSKERLGEMSLDPYFENVLA